MTKRLLIAVISGLLFGCGQTTEPKENPDTVYQENQETSISFSEYTKDIKRIDLPFKTMCDSDLRGTSLSFPDSIVSKYGIDMGEVLGKIAENEKFVAILYVYPADIRLPIIQTSDKAGKKISKLQLFENYCGENEHSLGTARAEISKDLTISLRDSVITYDRNKKGLIIEKSKRTNVSSREFFINSEGQILEKK